VLLANVKLSPPLLGPPVFKDLLVCAGVGPRAQRGAKEKKEGYYLKNPRIVFFLEDAKIGEVLPDAMRITTSVSVATRGSPQEHGRFERRKWHSDGGEIGTTIQTE